MIYGTDVMSNALAFLCFLGGMMMVVEVCSLFWRRERVSMDYLRVPQGVAFVGEVVPLTFRIQVKRRVKRLRLILYPMTEGVTFSVFRREREPNEEKRNSVDRMLKFYRWQWLSRHLSTPFIPSETAEISLTKQEARGHEIELSVEFRQRGRWSLLNVRAHLPGVFGLLERSLKTTGERGEVIVAPQILPVRLYLAGGLGEEDSLSLETSSQSGESNEFLSLREYRSGDSWRKLNWKAMARTEKAMIQETEQPGVPTYAVVWNTLKMSRVEFETAAIATASLVARMAAMGVRGSLRIYHGTLREFSWEDGPNEIYQELAMIKWGQHWALDQETQPTAPVARQFLVCKEGQAPAERGMSMLVKINNQLVNGREIRKEIVVE